MIGMVGMGLEDTLNEVEVAYLERETERHGYASEAVSALSEWCFEVSDIPYLVLTIDCANVPHVSLPRNAGLSFSRRERPLDISNQTWKATVTTTIECRNKANVIRKSVAAPRLSNCFGKYSASATTSAAEMPD